MSNPPPTITKMSQGELDLHLYTPPGSPDGCDAILVIFGVKYKIFERLRKAALFPDDKIQVSNEQTTKQADNTRNWQSITLRWVWCDHSIWEAPHAYWCLKEELQEAQGSGKQARRVDFIRLRGANHYVSGKLSLYKHTLHNNMYFILHSYIGKSQNEHYLLY